jgi:N6-L-threonylcarbamoyladenine synthase
MSSTPNSFRYTKVFAIETSCDDTSLAVVELNDGAFIVPWIQAFSQIDLHQQYGGVMPEMAYRSHAEKIVTMIDPIIHSMANEIEAIVITARPGLPGSLIVGITAAHLLSKIRNKPIIEAHHILGHVFSVLCERRVEDIQLPYICLTASGGHNDLYLIEDAI